MITKKEEKILRWFARVMNCEIERRAEQKSVMLCAEILELKSRVQYYRAKYLDAVAKDAGLSDGTIDSIKEQGS